jgi:hypothetical protein
MSDRTKFFAEKETQEKAEIERRQREAEAKKEAVQALDATCVAAAAIYAPHFEKVAQELRAGGIVAAVEKDTKVIRAIDAHTREEYGGNVYLSLRFRAGGVDYELVYVVVQQPSVLGMLAWRRNNAPTYYVGPQSKASPGQLPNQAHVAEHHVNTALDAMKAG